MMRFFALMFALLVSTTVPDRAKAQQADSPAAEVARLMPIGLAADYATPGLTASGKARLERVEVIDRCRLRVTLLFPRTDGKGLSTSDLSLGDVTRIASSGLIVAIAQDGRAGDIEAVRHWMRVGDTGQLQRLVAALERAAQTCDPRMTGGPLMRQLGRASVGAIIESPFSSRTAKARDSGPFFSFQFSPDSPCTITFWRATPAQKERGEVKGMTIEFAKPLTLRRSGARFDFGGSGIWYHHGQSIIFASMADADIAARAFEELKATCRRR